MLASILITVHTATDVPAQDGGIAREDVRASREDPAIRDIDVATRPRHRDSYGRMSHVGVDVVVDGDDDVDV
jgi:hypothetical protein